MSISVAIDRSRFSSVIASGAVILCFVANVARAQNSYPTTSAPTQAWGGYTVAQAVPYQPMLTAPAAPVVITPEPPAGQAYTLANPIPLPSPPIVPGDPNTGQVWQPYAEIGAPTTISAPGTFPGMPLQEPIFPPTPEAWDLRASLIPPDSRNGFFQKAKFTATYLPQLNDDSLGWTDLDWEVVTALPFFTRENPIIITPSYTWHFLDRPEGFDLPSRLNDLTMDFHVFRVYDNSWIFDFAVTPGLYVDDHSFDSSDACRINGRAVAVYVPNPEWKWLMGVQYVNGAWNKIVPIAGFTYQPNEDVKYEAVFPQPRAAWRLPMSPIPGRDEYWFYLAGEFTTSIWAIEQDDGTPDTFAYRDIRFILGLEHKVVGGLSCRGELGWVFRRDMKIASLGSHEIGLDDTLMARVGLVY
ncbi:MAG: hypothetical protein WD468_11300 [Pirellulales bacterium]